MRGVGEEISAGTDTDEYVRALRANWYGPEEDETKVPDKDSADLE
jgi:hypothetical protein